MNFEKTKISKDFPFSIRFYLLKYWYFFPQGFTYRGTMETKRYNNERSSQGETIYECKAFWLIHSYTFHWLCFRVIFKTKMFPESDSVYRSEKEYRPDLKQKEIIGITKSQFN